MMVLALDTATAATVVAVVEVGTDRKVRVVSEGGFVDPRAHAEQLAPHIRAALAEARVRPGELTGIVAGTGPGPFTGLRVGLATAAAMGQALGIPTYGVCSLDGIGAATGAGAPAATGASVGPEPVLVATDARRREVYWAIYVDGARVTGPGVDRPENLVAQLAAHGVRLGYGEGARRYRDVLGLPVVDHPVHPDPAVLVAGAVDRIITGASAEPLVPRYLRRPDVAGPHPPKPATRP